MSSDQLYGPFRFKSDDCVECRRTRKLYGEPRSDWNTAVLVGRWKKIWKPRPARPLLWEDEVELCTQYRDTSKLSDEEFAEWLHASHLGDKALEALGPDAIDRFEDLYSKCGFTEFLGVLDFDTNTKSEQWDQAKADAGVYLREILEAAQLLNPELEKRLGFKLVQPWQTNANGGVHFELYSPAGYASPDLMQVVHNEILAAVSVLGITCNSNDRDKRKRGPWFVDTKILNKGADRRGGEVRLPWCSKEPGGYFKRPIDWSGREIPRSEVVQAQRIDLAKLMVVTTRRSISTLQGAVYLADRRSRSESRKAVARVRAFVKVTNVDLAVLSDDDRSFVERDMRLRTIWEKVDLRRKIGGGIDSSVRDVDMAARVLEVGGDEERAARITYAMPGSKTGRRGLSYFANNVLPSAKLRLARREIQAEDAVLRLAQIYLTNGQAGATPAATKSRLGVLGRQLDCGTFGAQAKCLDCNATPADSKLIQLRCQGYLCLKCFKYYVEKKVAWIEQEWPEKVWVRSWKINRSDWPSCKSVMERAIRLHKKDLSLQMRFHTGPGTMLAVATRKPESMTLPSATTDEGLAWTVSPDWVEVPRARAAQLVATVLMRRSLRLRAYITSGDPIGLATDAWLGRIRPIRMVRSLKRKETDEAGRRRTVYEKNLLPWPEDGEERKAAKAKREKQRQAEMTPEEIRAVEESTLAPCCGGVRWGWDYFKCDRATGKPIKKVASNMPRLVNLTTAKRFELTGGEAPPVPVAQVSARGPRGSGQFPRL